jgi:hypothetical protein
MTRATFTPTDEQRLKVTALVAAGVRHEVIVKQIINPESGEPIDPKTLRKAFEEEIRSATADAVAMVANALFEQAMGDGPQSVTAKIFFLKNRAPDEWRDKATLEVTGDLAERLDAAFRRVQD